MKTQAQLKPRSSSNPQPSPREQKLLDICDRCRFGEVKFKVIDGVIHLPGGKVKVSIIIPESGNVPLTLGNVLLSDHTHSLLSERQKDILRQIRHQMGAQTAVVTFRNGKLDRVKFEPDLD